MLASYVDKPSKLNNARPSSDAPPCFHIEWRVSGALALTRFGIASLSDLIRFDHTKFWDKNVLLYKLPTSAKLGTLLGTLRDARTDVKAGALTKRAREWKLDHSLKMDHSDDTVFVLHNALLSERQSLEKSVYKMIMKMFAPISFSAWERKTMLHLQKSQHMRALI